MKFYFKTMFLTLVIIGLLFFGKISIINYSEERLFQSFEAKIVRVSDGDTVTLEDGQSVRLLGINAPELHHPDLPVQKFGEEAKKYLADEIEGKTCVLYFNVNEKFDRYNRLLAYIYYNDRLINAELVKKGLAYAYGGKDKRAREILVIENIARRIKRGLWEHQEGGKKYE